MQTRRDRSRRLPAEDPARASIDYGSRWGLEGPPTGTYSVDTHPERFAPLHLVADALIDHLVATYDVRVSHDPANVGDFNRHMDFLRVTQLIPADPAAASLTFGFTEYPGVIVHAGLLHDFYFPVCGCDACDDSATGQVDLLEQLVFAVAAGKYRESYTPAEELPVSYSLQRGDGGSSGGSLATGHPVEYFVAAGQRLRDLPGGWTAWPKRSSNPICH